MGGDDWALEGFCAGATGWISGVADVAPARLRRALRRLPRPATSTTARAIYAALLPLARFDMTPKLVQYFKARHGRASASPAARAGRRGWRSTTPSAPLLDAGWRRCAERRSPHEGRAASSQAVDSHTEGMPTRVITGGVGAIPGATMAERKLHFEAQLDDLRTLLMYEPRGHSAMSGAILQPPTARDADCGVLFIEVSRLPADVRARHDRRGHGAGRDRHGPGARAGDRRPARHAGRAGRGAVAVEGGRAPRR